MRKHPQNRLERLEIKELKRKPRRSASQATETSDEIEIRPDGNGSEDTTQPMA